MLRSASAPGGAGARDGETVHLTVLVESAVGWRNLCRLLTEAHADTRPRRDRDPLPPRWRSTRCCERNEGLVCLTGCARDGALAGAWERGEPRAGRADRATAARRLRRRAPAGRAAAPAVAPRPRPQPLAGRRSRERLGVACVATGNVHAHDRRRAELQDALVAVRTALDPRGVRARSPRQHELGARLAGGDGGALRRPPGGGRRERPARRAAALRPHLRARLPLPGLRGRRGRPDAGRDLPRAARAALRRDPRGPRGRRGASRRSCG